MSHLVNKEQRDCESQQFRANLESRGDEDNKSEQKLMALRSHEHRKEFDYGTPRSMNFKTRQTYDLPAYDRADKRSQIMNKGKYDPMMESIGDDNLLSKMGKKSGNCLNSARIRQARV